MGLRLSGGRRLRSPSGQTARPTPARVRLALMNMLAADLPGCRWLDLCSGSGVMACEALQRGAKAVVAVEQDRQHAAVAKANLEAVRSGLAARPGVQVHCCEVGRWLRRGCPSGPRLDQSDRDGATATQPGAAQAGFELIYADPPYAAGLYPAICAGVAQGNWLLPGGILVLECGSSATPALEDLPGNWTLRDERTYGSTTVLLLQRPEFSCPAGSRDGIDSRQPRTDPSR
jgi:16S rRNA (guanine966-N2)-methyltransferase